MRGKASVWAGVLGAMALVVSAGGCSSSSSSGNTTTTDGGSDAEHGSSGSTSSSASTSSGGTGSTTGGTTGSTSASSGSTSGSASGASTSSGSTSSSSGSGSTSGSSSSSSSGTSSSSGGGNGCSGSTPVALKVVDYKDWCTISVNGMAGQTPDQTVCVAAGGSVSLSLKANSGFIIGTAPWHDTAGDTGSGDPGTMAGGMDTTSVDIPSGATSACVWACCPFPDGTGCTPGATLPCP